MIPLRVTVTGAGSLIGQAILKSLRHESNRFPCEVQGLDYFDDAFGFRFCDKAGLLPDLLSPKVSEAEWIDDLCERVSAFESSYLFVGADFELLPLARLKMQIESQTNCRIIVSDHDIVKACRDKYETFTLLKNLGMDVPDSLLPGRTYSEIVEQLGSPFIMKPRRGSRSRDLFLIGSEALFATALAKCEMPVMQEYLPGDSTEFSCGVNYLGKQVDTVCVLRRSIKDGNTSRAFSEVHPEVETYCRSLGEALKPNGPINIQLRLRQGRPHAFEINPRFSGTTYFRTLLGVNEVCRTLAFHEGIALVSNPQLRPGIVRRYFEETLETTAI